MDFKWVIYAALTSSLALPPMAAADVIDNFTLVDNGNVTTFSLPATTVYQVHEGSNQIIESIPEVRNGVSRTGSISFTIENFSDCFAGNLGSSIDGIALCGPAIWSYTFQPVLPGYPAFTGYYDFSFLPGTYSMTDTNTLQCGPPIYTPSCPVPYPQYTITITPEAATPVGATPEPGTLPLLATGMAGGFGVLRRRFAMR